MTPSNQSLISFNIDKYLNFQIQIDSIIVFSGLFLLAALILFKCYGFIKGSLNSFEINEAEFGIGNQKVKFTPNLVDRQIAYKIWVELSTRKIGIPIDTSNDVISEIYDSWFNFFSVTRELIKDVPVQKFRRKDTEQIIKLSIDVLNTGIRPHLTMWQARFRRWYNNQLDVKENLTKHPQDIQREFPQFSDLEKNLLDVNQRLIKYRERMYQIIST